MRECRVDGCYRTKIHSHGFCMMHFRRWKKNGDPGRVEPYKRRGDLLYRLADKFTVGDGCWEWVAGKDKDGYGKFRDGNKDLRAHRVIYELLNGPIPDGMVPDHLCVNASCVRPDHMEIVTPLENNRRQFARRTHCKNGHEFTEDNTYRPPQRPTHRSCRTCLRVRSREYHERKATQ